jgi:hypothetical protein
VSGGSFFGKYTCDFSFSQTAYAIMIVAVFAASENYQKFYSETVEEIESRDDDAKSKEDDGSEYIGCK